MEKQIAVAPLVGAWIEMKNSKSGRKWNNQSLPLWERGLKSIDGLAESINETSRSPCGSVD